MKLSLCLIALNEEKNIHLPLDSAYDIADEVILIDQKSEDKTVEIAKAYGKKVKVYEVDTPKNFLENKQTAIKKATGDWILQLDADEAITPELKEEIRVVIANSSEGGVKQSSGYNIPRKNWFLGRFLMKGGVYPDYVLRLYRRDKAHFNLEHLHENVIIDGEVGHLKAPMEHYADPDFSRYLMRWDRYTTFDAQELAKKGAPGIGDFIMYIIIKPKIWFLKTYFRHKGFMDGFPGFVFSLFSSLRFIAIYVKWWNMKNKSGGNS